MVLYLVLTWESGLDRWSSPLRGEHVPPTGVHAVAAAAPPCISVWLFLSKITASLRLVPEGLCPHPLPSVGQGPGQESRGWHLGQKGTQGRKLGDGGS